MSWAATTHGELFKEAASIPRVVGYATPSYTQVLVAFPALRNSIFLVNFAPCTQFFGDLVVFQPHLRDPGRQSKRALSVNFASYHHRNVGTAK